MSRAETAAPASTTSPARALAGAGHTPGPWRWELAENTKTIALKGGSRESAFGRFDMAVMTFRRWGMSGAQPHILGTDDRGILYPMSDFGVMAQGREHHTAWFKLIDHPDARLIAAAPTLAAALRRLLALCESSLSPDSDAVRPALDAARAALAAASPSPDRQEPRT